MNSTILIGLVVTACASGDEPDAAQFARLMKGLHGAIQDVSLVYEGELHYVGPADLLGRGSATTNQFFQGAYVYRADGAALLEFFRRDLDKDGLFQHESFAILGAKMEALSKIPDLAAQFNRPRVTQSKTASTNLGAINKTGSPQRILYTWYFNQLVDPQGYGYECQGWEEVDGQKCLRVQLNVVKQTSNPRKPTIRFWIDMDRGGHPLKVEDLSGSDVRMRTDRIELERQPLADGRSLWLPVRGVTETFQYSGGFHKTPLYRETYSVINDTIRINQGLADSLFTVAQTSKLPSTDYLRRLRKDFDRPPPPPPRRDAAGVKERLDKTLAEADEQAKRIEASSTARAGWSTTLLVQAALVAIGVVALGCVAAWKWRNR